MKSIKRRFLLAMTYAAYLSAIGLPSAYAMTTDADKAEDDKGHVQLSKTAQEEITQYFQAHRKLDRLLQEGDDILLFGDIYAQANQFVTDLNSIFSADPSAGRAHLLKELNGINLRLKGTIGRNLPFDLTPVIHRKIKLDDVNPDEANKINAIVDEFIKISTDEKVHPFADVYFKLSEGNQKNIMIKLFAAKAIALKALA
jgi:hypothetical protein